jgi:hypothetical protein
MLAIEVSTKLFNTRMLKIVRSLRGGKACFEGRGKEGSFVRSELVITVTLSKDSKTAVAGTCIYCNGYTV